VDVGIPMSVYNILAYYDSGAPSQAPPLPNPNSDPVGLGFRGRRGEAWVENPPEVAYSATARAIQLRRGAMLPPAPGPRLKERSRSYDRSYGGGGSVGRTSAESAGYAGEEYAQDLRSLVELGSGGRLATGIVAQLQDRVRGQQGRKGEFGMQRDVPGFEEVQGYEEDYSDRSTYEMVGGMEDRSEQMDMLVAEYGAGGLPRRLERTFGGGEDDGRYGQPNPCNW
jgi:hypothetical protein